MPALSVAAPMLCILRKWGGMGSAEAQCKWVNAHTKAAGARTKQQDPKWKGIHGFLTSRRLAGAIRGLHPHRMADALAAADLLERVRYGKH